MRSTCAPGASIHDLKLALRRLRLRPARGAATALTLALGIGASAAAFAAVDQVLVRDLPVRAQDELVVVWRVNPERGSLEIPFRPAGYEAVARGARSLSAVAGYMAWGVRPVGVDDVDGAYTLDHIMVAGDFFGVLGAAPALGRLLTPADDALGAAPVAVLSHDAWRGRFAADPGVVGSSLRMHDRPFTVVGVAPEGLDFPHGTDVWVTYRGVYPGWAEEEPIAELHVLGRMAPGVDAGTVAADVTDALQTEPGEAGQPAARPVVTSLEEHLVGALKPVLSVTLAAALLLLLAAIGNTTLLLLSGGRAAAHDVAVRRALGAEDARLVGRLAADAAVVGALGAVSGLALAWLALRGLMPMAPDELPRLDRVALDARSAGFGLLVGLVAAASAAAVSGLARSRLDVRAVLAAGGRGSTGEGARLGRSLAGLQVAFTVVSAAGAGLLVRTVVAMGRLDPGLDTERLTVVTLRTPYTWFEVPERYRVALEDVVRDLKSRAGIAAARPTLGPPLDQRLEVVLVAEGQDSLAIRGNPYVAVDAVLAGHFRALGIPVLAGRGITEADDRAAADPVVVVDEVLAAALWPGQDPLGKRMTGFAPDPDTWFTVVGVVAGTRYREYLELHPRAYYPMRRMPDAPVSTLLVRTAPGGPESVRALVDEAFARADPQVSVRAERRIRDVLARPMVRPRFAAGILLSFAAATLLLAALGVYGVFTGHVHDRTRELGVRLALGAPQRRIVGLVLGAMLQVAAVGAAVGLLAALWAGRLVESLLYGVPASDPWTLAAVVAGSLCAALLAGLVPALRAAATDPVVSLRGE